MESIQAAYPCGSLGCSIGCVVARIRWSAPIGFVRKSDDDFSSPIEPWNASLGNRLTAVLTSWLVSCWQTSSPGPTLWSTDPTSFPCQFGKSRLRQPRADAGRTVVRARWLCSSSLRSGVQPIHASAGSRGWPVPTSSQAVAKRGYARLHRRPSRLRRFLVHSFRYGV